MTQYKNFPKRELQCKCGCAEEGMDPAFMERLIALREIFGKPMVLSSAYRCENHPVERGKRHSGPHTTGQAVDVLVFGSDTVELRRHALELGFHGFGTKQHGEMKSRFLHIDTAPAEEWRPRPWEWSYS